MKLILACALLAFGCSTGGAGNQTPMDLAHAAPMPGWSLTGTLAGFTLQTEAVSGEAHLVNGTSTLVQLSSRGKICDLLQANSCPNGRILAFRIGGTTARTYTIVDDDQPGSGQARVLFVDLDTQCLENTSVSATSGTLTVTSGELAAGGLFSFSFDVTTPDGPASGQVSAPFCQI
jgi:hypothetical protein